MSAQDDILDTSTIPWEGDFDAQVASILRKIRLTANEVQNLRQIFIDLENAFGPHAPGCQVFPFGSVVTGLGIKTSDVDCYIKLPDSIQPSKQSVIYARNILRRYNRVFTDIFAIPAARVPIVKFLHIPTNLNCDVNFKSPSGVQNSKLLGFLLHLDRRALPLALLVKYWSKVYRFTGTNLMPNYALTMMVIYYLQMVGILPAVCVLQKNIPRVMIDGWNCSFDESVTALKDNKDTLYDLLGGFFKYYSKFNYDENIISPYTGRLLTKKAFEALGTVPNVFQNYKYNVSANICKPLRTDTKMCIQDPFQHNRNCSVAIFPKLAATINAHFQFASRQCEAVSSHKFLKVVFTEDNSSKEEPKLRNNLQPKKTVLHNKIKKHRKQKKHPAGNYFHEWFRQMNRQSKGNT